jgi:hypothetical protein
MLIRAALRPAENFPRSLPKLGGLAPGNLLRALQPHRDPLQGQVRLRLRVQRLVGMTHFALEVAQENCGGREECLDRELMLLLAEARVFLASDDSGWLTSGGL